MLNELILLLYSSVNSDSLNKSCTKCTRELPNYRSATAYIRTTNNSPRDNR